MLLSIHASLVLFAIFHCPFPRLYPSFLTIMLSLIHNWSAYTMLLFFSQEFYCLLPKGFVLLWQSCCSFTNILLSSFTMLLSQFYCLILLHCYYFHNTNTVLFPQFYPRGAKVYKFCRNSPRAWIDWRSRQSRISRNWCPCSSVFMYKREKNQRKIAYPHNCMLPVTNLPKFRTTKSWLLLP